MRLKTRLKALVEGKLDTVKVQPNFEESQQVRQQVKEWMQLPLEKFLNSRTPFNSRHGLVFKLLKTDPKRLQNGVLASHDMNYWLRQNKPVPALWIVRLCRAQVPRNQFLKWSRDNLGAKQTDSIKNWTKKWGIPEDDYSLVESAKVASVAQARKVYAERQCKGKARQVLGNSLLQQVALQNADEVYAFYRSLNKDIFTFQIMFAAMAKSRDLQKYYDAVWNTAERQQAANNLRIDAKLRETAAVAKERASTRAGERQGSDKSIEPVAKE